MDFDRLKSLSIDEGIDLVLQLFSLGKVDQAREISNFLNTLHPQQSSLGIIHKIIHDKKNHAKSKQKSVVSQNNKDQLIVNLAKMYDSHNHTDDAKRLYKLLKQTDPSDFLPYFRLGMMEFENKHFSKAITELSTANNIDPFHIQTLKKLGLSFYYSHQFVKALSIWYDGLILCQHTKNSKDYYFFLENSKLVHTKLHGFNKKTRNDLFKQRLLKLKQYVSNSLDSDSNIKQDQHSLQNDLDTWLENDQKNIAAQSGHTNQANKTFDIQSTYMQLEQFPSIQQPISENLEEEIDIKCKRLKNAPFFKFLSDKELRIIANFSSFKNFQENSIIAHRHDSNFGLYFIMRGNISSQYNTNTPIIYKPGAVIAHEDLIANHIKHSFTYKAHQESDLVFIDKAGFNILLSRFPKLAKKFLRYFYNFVIDKYKFYHFQFNNKYNASKDIASKVITLQSPKLNQSQIKDLKKNLNVCAAYHNKVIVNFEENIDTMFVVCKGQLKLVHPFSDNTYSEGQFFAENALLNTEKKQSPFKLISTSQDTEYVSLSAKQLAQDNTSNDILKIAILMLHQKTTLLLDLLRE